MDKITENIKINMEILKTFDVWRIMVSVFFLFGLIFITNNIAVKILIIILVLIMAYFYIYPLFFRFSYFYFNGKNTKKELKESYEVIDYNVKKLNNLRYLVALQVIVFVILFIFFIIN